MRFWGPGLAALAALLVTGCAGTSTFRPYPTQINPAIALLSSGETDQALHRVTGGNEKLLTGKDQQLYLLESGRISFIKGDFEASKSFFERAISEMELEDDAAVVQVSDMGAQTAAMIVNDNAVPYQAAGFERVFAYLYQTLNFLFMGDLDAAGIEARNALGAQERARERTQREVAKAQEKFESAAQENASSGLNMNQYLQSAEATIGPRYAAIDEIAGQVRSAYENPLNYYLSAFVIEMQGDVGTALPTFRDALELAPEVPSFQATVFRYSDRDDQRDLARRFGRGILAHLDMDGNGMGPELMIILSDGFIVQKQELSISIPFRSGLTAFSLPFYGEVARPYTQVELRVDGQEAGSLDPVISTQPYAYKELSSQMPAILMRALIRTAGKAVAADQANQQHALAGLGVSLLNLLTESADLRGWYTLPSHCYFYRGFLAAGDHDVMLRRNGQPFAEIPVQMQQDHVTLVYVTTVSGHTSVHQTTIRKPMVLSRRALAK
jgi:uncharacterized protein